MMQFDNLKKKYLSIIPFLTLSLTIREIKANILNVNKLMKILSKTQLILKITKPTKKIPYSGNLIILLIYYLKILFQPKLMMKVFKALILFQTLNSKRKINILQKVM